ncbi:hypothetical protein HPB50_017322 [Hyalomma asiaticum]|uniref:Uncharacterized protein n=1 Tax=Hyalomma asiaticum TaxID=266040 RepID=A0ACB7TPA0_HYAAI|nr:hypothetical protein HPB50_017322 [Hyalomma asiaticum]
MNLARAPYLQADSRRQHADRRGSRISLTSTTGQDPLFIRKQLSPRAHLCELVSEVCNPLSRRSNGHRCHSARTWESDEKQHRHSDRERSSTFCRQHFLTSSTPGDFRTVKIRVGRGRDNLVRSYIYCVDCGVWTDTSVCEGLLRSCLRASRDCSEILGASGIRSSHLQPWQPPVIEQRQFHKPRDSLLSQPGGFITLRGFANFSVVLLHWKGFRATLVPQNATRLREKPSTIRHLASQWLLSRTCRLTETLFGRSPFTDARGGLYITLLLPSARFACLA